MTAEPKTIYNGQDITLPKEDPSKKLKIMDYISKVLEEEAFLIADMTIEGDDQRAVNKVIKHSAFVIDAMRELKKLALD